MAKKEFPKVHFYDHDLIDMYDRTWQWFDSFLKKGNEKNGFALKYLNYPESNVINQFDACFLSFSLVYSNRNFPVISLLDNFYAKQEENGAIRGEYMERNGKAVLTEDNPEGVLPPLFAWAEYNIYHKLGLKKRVREIMPVLEKYFSWIEKNFRKDNGLYSVPLSATMMPNSPREGMVYPIDFNAQVAVNALYMSALGEILNDKEISYRYKRAFFSIKTRINTKMWNREDGFYYDLDKSENQIRVKTVASFWTLLAEIPNEERSDGLIEHLTNPEEFAVDNPVPTLSADEPMYDKFGEGFRGSVLPPFNYMVIKGLEKYGKFDLAREFSLRHLYSVLDTLHPEEGEKGALWEAYAPQHEGPAKWTGNKEFPRSMFLTYAALSSVTLIIENILGFYISLPRKTVDWTIPTLEIMGIENLELKRNMITILSNKSGRGWEIRLKSEKLYYLTINILDSKKKTLPIPSGKCSILIDKL